MASHREPIDIVMTTRNRPDYLQRTIDRIYACTRTPFKLHIIDDASDDGDTREYLWRLYDHQRVASVLFRTERGGLMANKNVGHWLAQGDHYYVTTDDDVLCPDVEPDWLERLLAALEVRPKLAVLALNHPGAFRVIEDHDEVVSYCQVVGSTFQLVRRAAFEGWALPHYRNNFGFTEELLRCGGARQRGWLIGFLTQTHCYHFGRISAATDGKAYGGAFIEPLDWKTLEPKE